MLEKLMRYSPIAAAVLMAANLTCRDGCDSTGPGCRLPTTLEKGDGDSQTAAVGVSVPVPPSIVVRDDKGNPVSAIPVRFVITGGGGSSEPPSPAIVITDSRGVARLTAWRLGPVPGENTVTVAAPRVKSSSVTFTAMATLAFAFTSQGGSHACGLTAGGAA